MGLLAQMLPFLSEEQGCLQHGMHAIGHTHTHRSSLVDPSMLESRNAGMTLTPGSA